MKILVFSNWQNTETLNVKSLKAAKRLAKQIKEEQKLPMIFTEKEYREMVK